MWCIALFLHAALCANVTLDWDVGWIDHVTVAGFTRRVIGVNGQFPIPSVFAKIGDLLVINLHNSLHHPLALHSHGLYHNGTPYNDGAAMITECGVAPNTGETKLIPLTQSGSYWLHGHSGGHYVDGLRTPLIIKPMNDSMDVDGEFIVGLYDWYNTEHDVLLKHYLSIYNPTGAEPIPDVGLINGKTDEIFSVKPNSRYLFRVISMAAFATFKVHITGHELIVVEVDGEEVEPKTVDEFVIAVAQRYSFIVRTKSSTTLNYQLQAEMDAAMFDNPPPDLNVLTSALIEYSVNGTIYQEPNNTSFRMLDEMTLHPVEPLPVVEVDQSFYYTVSFDLYENGTNHGAFNHTVLSYHDVAPLYTAITMGDMANNTKVYGPYNPTLLLHHLNGIEVIIKNDDANSHPFHLHGHKFQIIYQGKGDYNATLVKEYLQNVTNPVRRDTVITESGGYTVLRFVADNPGAWIFHCHIEWHLQAGLGAVFVEAPGQLQERVKLPIGSIEQCRKLGHKTSGNAMGFNDTTTFPGLEPFNLFPDGFQTTGVVALTSCIVSAIIGLVTIVWYSQEQNS